MATDYGVTTGDVVARLPIDESDISATSTLLNTSNISAYIESGSAQLAALLTQAGISASDADTLQQVKQAIIDYAVAESLAKMGRRGTIAHDSAWSAWQSALQRYSTNSGAFKERAAARTQSNVPSATFTESTTTSTRSQFKGRDYKF